MISRWRLKEVEFRITAKIDMKIIVNVEGRDRVIADEFAAFLGTLLKEEAEKPPAKRRYLNDLDTIQLRVTVED